MGLFVPEKSISVSSTVYNLAGDQTKRPSFLKTAVLGSALAHSTDRTIGQQINEAYLNGPGIKLRAFSRWAISSGYNAAIGLGSTSLTISGPVDPEVLKPLLPQPPSPQTITIQNSFVGVAQWIYWVEKWMVENYLDQLYTDWTYTYDEPTNTVTVTLKDASEHTFELENFVKNEEYLYAAFFYITPAVLPDPDAEPPIEGSPEIDGPLQYLIYKKGDGSEELDALFVKVETAKYFLPYIPILLDQKLISPGFLPGIYALNRKATRKALGNTVRYDDLLVKIFSNPAVGQDVHYVYIAFGVSANVIENACRRYIYEFMLDVMSAGTNTVLITSSGSFVMNYFMQILWQRISEQTGSGHLTNPEGNPAKPGEVWFQTLVNLPYPSPPWPSITKVRLNWQVTANSWRYLEIDNLIHINLIYGGKGVITSICDALAEPNESGFIFPLNAAIYNNISLVDSTQMSTASAFLVFNSYKVKKAPWYSAGFFKVILIVVAIAITVFTAGAGGIGLLGANIAVGTLLGLEGVAAVIAGAIANALAAMIVIRIIQFGAEKFIGGKLGEIVGGVLSVFAIAAGTGFGSGLDFSQIFEQLTSPVNLLKITEAAGNAYAKIMQGNAQSIVKQTESMVEQYKALSADVEKKTEELFGVSGADLSINPLALTDVDLPNVKKNILFAETPESFFSRTLLSGSEIADLSMSFVNSFCDLTLSTKLSPMSGA